MREARCVAKTAPSRLTATPPAIPAGTAAQSTTGCQPRPMVMARIARIPS